MSVHLQILTGKFPTPRNRELAARDQGIKWREQARFVWGSGNKLLTARMHELAALRHLGERMSEVEADHRRRVERGDNRADVDRDTAQLALSSVSFADLIGAVGYHPLSTGC